MQRDQTMRSSYRTYSDQGNDKSSLISQRGIQIEHGQTTRSTNQA